jgi:isoleucyl-tRNA synthetase
MDIKLMTDDSTYSSHEDHIMKKWDEDKVYEVIQLLNKNGPTFRFMDGPPFVSSNSLHFGHLMIGFLKSTILNYRQMKGMNCLNELGYDCHGLPIEMVANKQLGVYTKKEVEEYGIGKYNKSCKDMIKTFSGAWTPIYERIGRWANFNKTYKTMDTNFMESVWWVFGQLFKKDLIYRGHQVMPYSNACNSPLSNFEAGQNYKDVDTKSAYVLFELTYFENTYAVAWTTTPWTLPSNLALCVNHEGEYDWIESNGKTYICAKDLVKNLDIKDGKVVRTCKGSDLVGLAYLPLFNYMNDYPCEEKFRIIADYKKNYVDLSPSNVGTGIVHISPFYGEDDFRVCVDNMISDNKMIDNACTIDDNGKFLPFVTEFAGRLVTDKETNDEIIKYLKINGKMLRTQMYTHSYPYCYRTDTPLIYKVTSSYFVKVTSLKDDLIKNNEKVTWHPPNIGTGRFKSWLENVKDWGVSRNRFFGTPLPIWVSDDGQETICVSSIDELVELANLTERPKDIHREFIDSIEIPSKLGKGMLKNVRLVLDCWFESGCVPIAQLHYPFENTKAFDSVDYLSDFIAEGLDQTRGWFYTLMVISTAIFNKPAFKDVICTGLILDETGLKFSKKYGNFKDPMVVLNKYGADVTRMYLLNSPTTNADPLLFNESSIEKVKQRIIPYINAVKLFLVHAKDHQSKGFSINTNLWSETTNIMDKWILTNISELVENIKSYMEDYKVDKAITSLLEFVEDLANWYVKLNRDRIRGLNGKEERDMSLSVLYKVLATYIKAFAPFTPFLSEYLYDYMKVFVDSTPSVHYCDYPVSIFADKESMNKFNILKDVIKNIRTLRYTLPTHTSMKIPIYKAIIFHNEPEYINTVKFFEEAIKEEVNCIEIEYDNLADNLLYKIIPNAKTIGKKFRSEGNIVKEKLTNLDPELVGILYADGCKSFTFELNNKTYTIDREDYTIECVPSQAFSSNPDMISKIEGELMIAIDKRYTIELHNIYQVRKLGTGVQRLRRSTSLNPWNKIIVNFKGSDKFVEIYESLKKDLNARLLCQTDINRKFDKEIYAESKFEFEHYENATEIISFEIYLI